MNTRRIIIIISLLMIVIGLVWSRNPVFAYIACAGIIFLYGIAMDYAMDRTEKDNKAKYAIAMEQLEKEREEAAEEVTDFDKS